MRANFVLTEVVAGLRRNLTMTVAMIITTSISLGFFGGGLLAARQISEMRELYFDKLQVSIYLNDNITQPQRDTLRSQLDASPEVADYQFLTKEQAYDRFKKLFQGNPNLVEVAGPDDLPAAYVVRLKNPQRYTVLDQQFSGQPGVAQVEGQNEVLDRIFDAFNRIRNGAIFVAVIQALAALLLIANTIQVAAFNRRVETGIMRLVGASRWYTQLPFMLEAAVAGLAGAVLAMLWLVLGKVLFVDKLLSGRSQSGIFPPLDYNAIVLVSPWIALVGVALATVAGYVTLRLYVRL
jgi:cell division transport system permease protein